MMLKGKVVNLLPSLKPNRAIIRIENWDESFTVPLGDLKVGQRVSIDVNPVLVSGAAAGSSPHPR
jgi:hypothetical protein